MGMTDRRFYKEARVAFTTNLPVDFLQELQHLSEATGLRRNTIIERAFYLWNEARTKTIEHDKLQVIKM